MIQMLISRCNRAWVDRDLEVGHGLGHMPRGQLETCGEKENRNRTHAHPDLKLTFNYTPLPSWIASSIIASYID